MLLVALLFHSSVLERLRREIVKHLRESRGEYRVLVGKPEGKSQLERPRCRWENNIKVDLQEVGCGSMDFIGVARIREFGWHL